jgi:hypothetical protein
MTESPCSMGREEADRLLKCAQSFAIGANQSGYTFTADDRTAIGQIAAYATAHALLAIESRLGELVEQQAIANALEAQRLGVSSKAQAATVARALSRDLDRLFGADE